MKTNKAILFTAIMALFISCQSDMERIKTITSINGLPTESATDIEIIHTDSAIITMIVTAPELKKYDKVDEPYTEFPKGLVVQFYNNKGTVDSKLSANYAKRIDKTNIWEAKYDVVAVGKNGSILNTELLYWDEDKEKIYTDNFVKVTEGESILYGNGFESNQDFTVWKILHPTGEVYTNE
ncbi:MAG: LPS export ABC transporter periplasmic protein LptC [Chlorobi bacterium]|nr:LPS export ABC transporter periplasmic protein LptC [Chlorobiota bacterium]